MVGGEYLLQGPDPRASGRLPSSDPSKSSRFQASKAVPGPDPPAPGRFGPLLVLLVSGSHSCEADFGRLDPFKSSKSPFSEGIPTRKSPSPGVEVPCSFSLLSAAPTGIWQISVLRASEPQRPQNPSCPDGHFVEAFYAVFH